MGAEGTGRVTRLWNAGWRFAEGAHAGAEQPGFDDAGWQEVGLPHDWAIAKPFDPEGDPNTGKLPWRGEGWYRKHLGLSVAEAGKRLYLDFGAVMACPSVYVNGELAGSWDCGYSSFRVDITDYVDFGADNVVAVHADTREHGSRWYPGAGIYRDVHLVLCEPIHLAHWGVCVTTPRVSEQNAQVAVKATVENHTGAAECVTVRAVLLDPDGREVARAEEPCSVGAGDSRTADLTLSLALPRLWDIDHPVLYTARVTVLEGEWARDDLAVPFGIRTFSWSGDDGFQLNGRRVLLRGANLHHDHGALGAAFYPRAMERQLEILREMGCNAIRTSHNPPAEGLLDLCDRMGFVVIDELADKWWATNDFHGTDARFEEHFGRNVANLVRRDRNHPCIVLWSMGNEITEIETNERGDARRKVELLAGLFRAHDPTRPVTLERHIEGSLALRFEDFLDAETWHYGTKFLRAHEAFPALPVIQSESASCFSTRGFYELPVPEGKTDFSPSRQLSSYDHTAAPWGDIADVEFHRVERYGWLAGEFVWTGLDYLGEPTPVAGEYLGRPLPTREAARSSFFGIVDLAGIPKDRYYLYRSHWAPEKTTVHILPHWNWAGRDGQPVPVYVYTNGDEAELFLNGIPLGRRRKLTLEELEQRSEPDYLDVLDRYRLRWMDVPYRPGTLRAVAYRDGQAIGETTVRTAGPPARLTLTPDRALLTADGRDLSYILVEAFDAGGIPCPLADNLVRFDLEGPAEIAGVDNGDPHSLEPFQASERRLFFGKAVLILRTREGEAGVARIRAIAGGLEAGTCEVAAR